MGRSDTVIGGARMWLLLPSEAAEPQIVEVSKSVFTLGRGDDADLRLEDPKVSAHHAQILIVPGKPPELHDLGSTNGTFVNGVPLKKPVGFTGHEQNASVQLAGNELIRCGDTVIVASLIDPRVARRSKAPD